MAAFPLDEERTMAMERQSKAAGFPGPGIRLENRNGDPFGRTGESGESFMG